MRIGIDIRSTLKRTTGIGKYTLNLINALGEIDADNAYYLYSRKNFLSFKKHLPRLPAKNFYHRVDYFKKGPDVVLPAVDVFHTSSYDLERPKMAKRFIVTVHDVIIKAYPHGHDEKTIREIDEKMKRVLPQADLLIADSRNTKQDIMEFYGIKEEKIKVIYPGVNTSRRSSAQYCSSGVQSPLRERSREPYILFVGTLEPRKNVQGLIWAFNWLKKEHGIKHRLVIAGMKGWMYENIFKEYENSEYKNEIVFKGYVSGKELAGLYSEAAVFVYPSFYEGFGFPIVEAFSAGVPVVTSKTSSCGEIAGEAALLVSPENHKEIAEAILKIINNEILKQELIKRGFERSKEFTWQRTAREFLRLLQLPSAASQ